MFTHCYCIKTTWVSPKVYRWWPQHPRLDVSISVSDSRKPGSYEPLETTIPFRKGDTVNTCIHLVEHKMYFSCLCLRFHCWHVQKLKQVEAQVIKVPLTPLICSLMFSSSNSRLCLCTHWISIFALWGAKRHANTASSQCSGAKRFMGFSFGLLLLLWCNQRILQRNPAEFTRLI